MCKWNPEALDVKDPNPDFPNLAKSPHKLTHYQVLEFEMDGVLKLLSFLPESYIFSQHDNKSPGQIYTRRDFRFKFDSRCVAVAIDGRIL